MGKVFVKIAILAALLYLVVLAPNLRQSEWNRCLKQAPIQVFIVERQMGVDDVTLVLAGWSGQTEIPRDYLRYKFWALNGGSPRVLHPGETVRFPKYQ
jgi:hypothetical protein